MSKHLHICEVCGAPATNSATDVYVADVHGVLKSQPCPIIHYGCAQHPAKSREHNLTSWYGTDPFAAKVD